MCTYLPHLLVSAYLLILQNLRHSVMQLLSHILHKTNISWWNVVWFSWEKKIFMCNIKRAMHIRLGKVNQSSNFITKKKLYMQYQYQGISFPILLDYNKIECEFHRKGSRIQYLMTINSNERQWTKIFALI